MIVYDPRLPEARKGSTNDNLVLNIDIPATILEYANVPIPEHYEGAGLASLIDESTGKWRSDFFIEHRMEHEQIPKYAGIHDKRYVYANYYEQEPPYEYLHDLEQDPDQLENLAFNDDYQAILESLRERMKTNPSMLTGD